MNNVARLNNSASALDLEFNLHGMTNPIVARREGMSFVESAKGVYVTIEGKRYIDGWSGLGCVNIGYGDDEVIEAAYAAMKKLSFYHSINGVSNLKAAELAAKLAGLSEGKFAQFFFVSTGSDAMESAVKMVWRYWRLKGQPSRRMLISRQHTYHGNTIVAACLTSMDFFHGQFGLPLSGLVRTVDAPYWNRYGRGITPEECGKRAAESLDRAIREIGPENVAAFVVEPIQTSAGMVSPPDGYFDEVQKICKRHGVLIVADEIVTGFGKTGTMFAHQNCGLTPDVIVLAKGLTSAYFPVSAVGISKEISSTFNAKDEDFAHGFTNVAHPVGAAVALANIGVIEKRGLVAHVRDVLAPKLAAWLAKFSKFPNVGEVRSRGILGAIDYLQPGRSDAEATKLADATYEAARERGLLLRVLGTSITTVFPMITTADQLDEAMTILYASVEAVSAGKK